MGKELEEYSDGMLMYQRAEILKRHGTRQTEHRLVVGSFLGKALNERGRRSHKDGVPFEWVVPLERGKYLTEELVLKAMGRT